MTTADELEDLRDELADVRAEVDRVTKERDEARECANMIAVELSEAKAEEAGTFDEATRQRSRAKAAEVDRDAQRLRAEKAEAEAERLRAAYVEIMEAVRIALYADAVAEWQDEDGDGLNSVYRRMNEEDPAR